MDIAQLSAGAIARVLSVVADRRDRRGAAKRVGMWWRSGERRTRASAGRLAAADREVVRRAFVATASAHLAARPLQDLSDGERQRVLIARGAGAGATA